MCRIPMWVKIKRNAQIGSDKLHRSLKIVNTLVGFPDPFLHVVIKSINLPRVCQCLVSLFGIGSDGQLRSSLYDKSEDFNFHITYFPFLSSNILYSPAYGGFISQLIRYARTCSCYECFILRAVRLSFKLLGQECH